MQISSLDPGTSPLSAEQSAAVNQLVGSLTPVQVAWLGGYLSGVAGYTQSLAGLLQVGGPTPAGAPMPLAGATGGGGESITVLYGTQTGNSEKVAKEVAAKAAERGLSVELKDMGNYRHAALKKETYLLVIVSTHGEGDPPDRVMELHNILYSNRAPKLKELEFSVLALGDRTYQHYCKIGKDFDSKLEELGGTRLYDRADCDVDYEDTADAWIDGVLDVLKDKIGAAAPAGQPAMGGFPMLGGMAAPAKSKYNKKNPFPARLLDKIVLNDEGSEKETIHVELSLEESGLNYLPGDSLGVFPTNNPETVDLVLEVAKVEPDAQVTMHNGEGGTIREMLTHHVEINALTPDVIEKYADLGDIAELKNLMAEENFQQLHDYLHGRDVIDLLKDHPIDLYANDLAEVLRKLPPRLYSIASSLEAYPEEVHLCIAAVRYESYGRQREGVCSTYFADRAPLDAEVPVYVHENNYFRLPDSPDTPIIMIGPGTGVAPFRAFLQHREMLDAEGDSWLFFGEQHFLTDFLYQAEWLQFLDTGVLNRMDVAFSRDQEHKVYVQHRMKEKASELYEWLQRGAHLYVCGDESRMAHDVHAALIEIIAAEGKMDQDAAADYVKNLQKSNRYQRDVY